MKILYLNTALQIISCRACARSIHFSLPIPCSIRIFIYLFPSIYLARMWCFRKYVGLKCSWLLVKTRHFFMFYYEGVSSALLKSLYFFFNSRHCKMAMQSVPKIVKFSYHPFLFFYQHKLLKSHALANLLPQNQKKKVHRHHSLHLYLVSQMQIEHLCFYKFSSSNLLKLFSTWFFSLMHRLYWIVSLWFLYWKKKFWQSSWMVYKLVWSSDFFKISPTD